VTSSCRKPESELRAGYKYLCLPIVAFIEKNAGQTPWPMNAVDLLPACFNEAASVPSCGGIVWEDLIRTAGREAVLPALHSRLENLGVWPQLPVEVASFLFAVEELNLERNRAILTELTTVALLLNEAGIEPVLLKGTAYCALGVYENPATRYMWDVDLFIPEPQLSTAVEVLVRNGFEQNSSPLAHFRHHHPPLQRNGSIAFELHHVLGMGVCESLLPARDLFEQSLGYEFHGARVRVPCPEHLMMHLIMHSQIQHSYHERIWPPLRAMYDLVLLNRRFAGELDWSAIRSRFRKVGESGTLDLHLLQTRNVLGAEIPYPIRLTAITYLRWIRRELLRALPPLRYLDPIYMYSTVLVRRLRLMRNALSTPGGWRHITKELLAPGTYRRLLVDIIKGYGR
jgi:hypothetical protein